MTNQERNLNLANYIITLASKQNAKENIALLLESLFDSTQKDKKKKSAYKQPLLLLLLLVKRRLKKCHKTLEKFSKQEKFVPTFGCERTTFMK